MLFFLGDYSLCYCLPKLSCYREQLPPYTCKWVRRDAHGKAEIVAASTCFQPASNPAALSVGGPCHNKHFIQNIVLNSRIITLTCAIEIRFVPATFVFNRSLMAGAFPNYSYDHTVCKHNLKISTKKLTYPKVPLRHCHHTKCNMSIVR